MRLVVVTSAGREVYALAVSSREPARRRERGVAVIRAKESDGAIFRARPKRSRLPTEEVLGEKAAGKSSAISCFCDEPEAFISA